MSDLEDLRNRGHRASLLRNNPEFMRAVEACQEDYVKMFVESVRGPDGQQDRDEAHLRYRCLGDVLTHLSRVMLKGEQANKILKAKEPETPINP